MAKPKDEPAAVESKTTAKDPAPKIETPKTDPVAAAAPAGPAAPTIDAIKMVRAAAAKSEPIKSEPAAPVAPTAEDTKPILAATPRWTLPPHTRLAAGIALAVALGAVAGVAATASLMRDSSTATEQATRALQNSVAQLSSDLASLKTGISTSQRAAVTQLTKLTERLDHAEKAQAEPTAKLARLQESIDKLGLRQQQAAAPAPEVTGSVPPKDEAKVAEGWRLRDFYAGRAVVENRTGKLFEIAPGTNLPGLGKVEIIKRDNGRVVVVTPGGIIAASLEPRRPSYSPPYRYY